MGNKKHHGHDKNRDDRNRQNGIPDDVKSFVKLKWKKFLKENKWRLDDADGKKEKKKIKKELQREFFDAHLDFLPKTIWWAISQGHRPENQDTMSEVKCKLYDPEFVKYLYKLLKDDEEEIRNIEMLPIMYSVLLQDIKLAEAKADKMCEELDIDVEGQVGFETKDIKKLILFIIRKKFKKMCKKDISEEQAFDYLCAIPTTEVLKSKGQSYYYCGRLLKAMYEHAAKEEVKPNQVFSVIFKDNEGDPIDMSGFIIQVLLERKEKISSFNEKQTALFNKITEWGLDTLEGEYGQKEIDKIIRQYIRERQNDHHDSNRRIYLANVSAENYPKISAVVKVIANNDDLKRYL